MQTKDLLASGYDDDKFNLQWRVRILNAIEPDLAIFEHIYFLVLLKCRSSNEATTNTAGIQRITTTATTYTLCSNSVFGAPLTPYWRVATVPCAPRAIPTTAPSTPPSQLIAAEVLELIARFVGIRAAPEMARLRAARSVLNERAGLVEVAKLCLNRVFTIVKRDELSWEALSAEHRKEMDEVIAILTDAADHGLMLARRALAEVFNHGYGVVKDQARALELYTQAAEQGATP